MIDPNTCVCGHDIRNHRLGWCEGSNCKCNQFRLEELITPKNNLDQDLCDNCNHQRKDHENYIHECLFLNCNCKQFEVHSLPGQPYQLKQQGNPEFLQLLEQSKEIHLRKSKDYASNSNPFSNFEFSSWLIAKFPNEQDKSFIALIGTKLARLSELSDGRKPNNEAIDDSFLDLFTYVGLWAAYRKRYPYDNKRT